MAYDNNYGSNGDNQGGFRRDDGFRKPSQEFTGNWVCGKCGKEITKLPFNPDPARLDKLLCRDCHKERQQSFRGNYR